MRGSKERGIFGRILRLKSIRDVIGKTAQAMPAHEQFIDQHCRAEPFELRALASASSV